MIVAIIAGLAMLAQDIVAVPLTQAEARNRAHLAGILDTVGWLVAITTTFVSVNTLQGRDLAAKVLVVAFVSVANYAGTVLGTKIGARYVHEDATKLAQRVAALEARLAEDLP